MYGRKLPLATLANIQNCQIKYGKLPANKAEEIPWNKLFLDLICPYFIRIKGKK